MDALEGRVALVTGGGSGIGQATARRLAADGMKVCVVDIDGDAAAAVADEIGGLAVTADVSDSAQVDAAFAACIDRFGAIDLAHLNAGIMVPVEIGATTDEDYERIRGVNLDGVVYGARAAVCAMRDRTDGRRGGVIVATSSMAGIEPYAAAPLYTLTKFAVVGFIRAIALALVDDAITAHAVCPGLTDTPIFPPGSRESFIAMGIPLADPGQVADAVVRAATSGPELSGTCWAVHPDGTVAHEFADAPGPHKAIMENR
jgi:NAD(P)-dependent dehydrogenase (short-subunit alcohol dehydrogenase family)